MNPTLETTLRIGCFVGVLLTMSGWEIVAPRRALTVGKPWRWASNLSLVAINSAVIRLLVPLTAVGAAMLADEAGWGLFHFTNWPVWLEFLIAVVLLDFTVYLQHVMSHAVPAFWKVHLVHHADLDFDVTTGLRFHTLEILLSMLLKVAVVAALGPPVWSVLVFEVLLNATAMFNHSNVRMPTWLDRCLRLVVVTPDMHRVHHSVVREEANSNFGFNLPWWDYLLGTYRSQPSRGHEEMTIGVSQLREERQVERLHRMLAIPFRAAAGNYPICTASESEPVCSTSRRQDPD